MHRLWQGGGRRCVHCRWVEINPYRGRRSIGGTDPRCC